MSEDVSEVVGRENKCRNCLTMSGLEKGPPGRRPRPRLESLSDLIYGLSLSVSSISLIITSGQGTSGGDINRNILEFLFVFLILITSWIIYTSDMSVLPNETRLVTFLNIILLIAVAIFPYLFDQVVSTVNLPSVQDYASILLGINYAGILFIAAMMAHLIAREEDKLVERELVIMFRRSRNIAFVLVAVILLSIATPWDWTILGVHARLFLWYVPVIMFWSNRMRSRPYGIPHGAYQAR